MRPSAHLGHVVAAQTFILKTGRSRGGVLSDKDSAEEKVIDACWAVEGTDVNDISVGTRWALAGLVKLISPKRQTRFRSQLMRMGIYY